MSFAKRVFVFVADSIQFLPAWLVPPGGAWRRVDERSEMKLLVFTEKSTKKRAVGGVSQTQNTRKKNHTTIKTKRKQQAMPRREERARRHEQRARVK